MAPLPPPPPPPPRLPPPPPPPGPAFGAHVYDHTRSRWGLGDAFIAMAIFFGVSIVLGFTFFILEGEDATLTGPWLPALVVVPALCQFGYVSFISRTKGEGLVRDFRAGVAWSDVAVGAGLCISALILAGITAAITIEITGDEGSAAVADLLEDSEESGGLTVWIYLMAFLGATAIPIVEEVLFRGLWWSALEKRGLNQWATLAITSVVFAAVHLELWRTPVLIVLGAVIGLGRITTGRIGASIAAHMYVNAIGMIFLLIELS